jgi:hypothetical protein
MIRINKEEALILAQSLSAHKFAIAEMGRQKEDAHVIIDLMNQLQTKLENYTSDERMIGRTSSTDAYSRIKRYLLKKNPKINF